MIAQHVGIQDHVADTGQLPLKRQEECILKQSQGQSSASTNITANYVSRETT